MLGEVMAAEMAAQPEVLARLISRRRTIVDDLRDALPGDLAGISLVARGSSDNTSIWARYVLELASQRPVALVAPSLVNLYRVNTDLRRWSTVAVSQSGETPEIVTALERCQTLGAFGLAITNRSDSPLAGVADLVLGTDAGEEHAVPATKTVTAQLAVFGFLAEALGEAPWEDSEWDRLPQLLSDVIDDTEPARRAAQSIDDAEGTICVGRGFLFGVALEAALKLKETSGILAQGYSAADLRHGPIAVIERDFPVLTFTAPGPVAADMEELRGELRDRGARLLSVGVGTDLPVPEGLSEALVAITATVRAQQVALELARHRGLDPDNPPGLSKVTQT